MALDRTSGFDLLVQISEAEINSQLETKFLAGMLFPMSLQVPVNSNGVVGVADLNFATPVADFDRPRPRMGLVVPFVNSQLTLTSPAAITVAPLGGTITIVDSIEVVTRGSTQTATLDFKTGAPAVSVVFDAASQALLVPLLAAAGFNINQAQNLMAGLVLNQLQSAVGHLDLTPAIPVADDTDPTTVFNFDVTTINDTSAIDADCVVFGVRMASDSGGNINNATANFIPAGSQSLIMMSNFWLLARVMRQRVAMSLGVPITTFNTPLSLNQPIAAPGGQGTLTRLDASVVGNRIAVDGEATASGTGWHARSQFNFFIDIALTGGSLVITATTPSVHTDVDLEWWVWLVSLGLGGLFGGIVGVIVAAIVLAIVQAVAGGIVDNLVAGALSGALGKIPVIPLGPIGGALTLTGIVLDDLELRSTIAYSVSVPIADQGGLTSLAGFAVDLDSGTISTNATYDSDLIWNPGLGISTNRSARLTISGASFDGLTPPTISRLPLLNTNVALPLIPVVFDLPWFGHDEVVFGIRTTQGRYAKCRAWRSVFEASALHLEWITYDNPVPSLDIAAQWSVLARGPATEYVTPDCEFCRTNQVSWCGVFEAWPKLMAFPIDYQWCLCGHVLEEGEGTVPSATGPISFKLDGRRLSIQTDLGQSVDCELCVSAIDARDNELYTCVQLAQPGVQTTCHACEPSRFKVEVIDTIPELRMWRPLFAEAQRVSQ